MTALEALAVREARVQYDRARRRHELAAITEYRAGHVIGGYKAAAAARSLQRFGPSETIVVREIG